MDTNPAHDGNYQSQDGLRRVPRESEARPRSAQPQNSEPHPSEPDASGSAGNWSTIREMARDFGVSIRALRFYEDRGLLHPRREGTARRYSARDRLYLKMILKGKQLGFTLSEIHDILAAREATNGGGEGATRHSITPDLTTSALQSLDFEEMDLEMGLPPEQIVAQISHLERQRRDLDEAIVALRDAHRRLLEAPCRATLS
jgi:DNA-binding transcriptional MerR regulator